MCIRKRVRVSESIIEPESRARKVMITQTTVDNNYHNYRIHLHAFYIPHTHLFSSRCRGAYSPF